MKIPEGKGRPIVKYDSSNGKILKRYRQLSEMARDIDTSNASAYYRIKSQRSINGELFAYEEDWEKRFPMLAKKNDKKPEPVKTEAEEVKVEVADKKNDKKNDEINEQTSEQADNQTSEPTADMVNHPPHYCTGDIECWDAMVSAFGLEWMRAYATVTAFKYIWRAKHKGRFAEDMKKAAWYEAKAAEMEGNLNG